MHVSNIFHLQAPIANPCYILLADSTDRRSCEIRTACSTALFATIANHTFNLHLSWLSINIIKLVC